MGVSGVWGGSLELCRSGGKRVGACVMPWLAVLWPLPEITAKPKWAVKTGPGATSGTAAKALSVRCIEA